MRKLTTSEFISIARNKHGDKFDYSYSEYTGSSKRINITCRIHGVFSQIARNHTQGKGCLKCQHEEIGSKIHGAARNRRKEIVFSKDKMSIEIPLTKDKTVIADAEFYDLLSGYNWCYLSTGYAVTTEGNSMLLMHALISRTIYNGELMDHISRDKLDNRLSNLRIATTQENSCNTSGARGSTSKYKGVHWNKRLQKWNAKISPNGKGMHLGVFEDEKLAAKAYNNKAKALFGEFAYLNTI